MAYHYDVYGWFTSQTIAGRSTDLEPTTTSETTTPGAARANWSGYAWVERPYVAPVVESETPPVPSAVTMRQARLALFAVGLLTAVDTAIDALDEPARTAARIEWDYSNELQRTNPLVATLGPALGLSEAQVDALFIAAAVL